MAKVVVTEEALRQTVREALWNKEFSGWSANHDEPATVNSTVDPSVAVTDPVNPNFTPQTKTEFGIAVNQLVKNLPDSDMSGLFGAVKSAVEQDKTEKDEEEMNDKAQQNGTKQVEAAIRAKVRNIINDLGSSRSSLSEARPDPWKNAPPVTGPLPPVTKIPAGVHGGEATARMQKSKDWLRRGMGKAIAAYEKPVEEDPPESVNPENPEAGDGVPDAPEAGPAVAPKRKAYKATAIGAMDDVGGASLETIANELGFSVAGAKQAVDKALEKARFLATDMDPDDLEILVLTSMNDYIKYLSKSEELSPADIQLMKDHPEVVRELDGFRDFLSDTIRKARRGAKLLDPARDEEGAPSDDDDSLEDVDDDSVEKPKSKRPPPVSWDLEDVTVGEARRPVLYLIPPNKR